MENYGGGGGGIYSSIHS